MVKNKSNDNHKMNVCLKNKLSSLIRTKYKDKPYKDLLGCSDNFFKCWIKYQFANTRETQTKLDHEMQTKSDRKNADKVCMNFGNYGTYWHIDHVLPVSRFRENDEKENNIIFNWKNMRPLEKTENIKKSNKIDIQLYINQLDKAEKFVKIYNSIIPEKHIEPN